MGRFAQDNGGGDFKQPPAGNHVARCIKIIDIGTHHGEYQGVPNVRNQVIVQWELPNETMDFDGKVMPLVISKFYTNSLSEKANLRKDLESWRARTFTAEELAKFDLMKILGAPCMLSVVIKEDGKAKVTTVAAMPKGFTCPPAVNPLDSFWLDEWDGAKFEALSKGFQKMIMDSDEYKAKFTPASQRAAQAETRGDAFEDDVPWRDEVEPAPF